VARNPHRPVARLGPGWLEPVPEPAVRREPPWKQPPRRSGLCPVSRMQRHLDRFEGAHRVQPGSRPTLLSRQRRHPGRPAHEAQAQPSQSRDPRQSPLSLQEVAGSWKPEEQRFACQVCCPVACSATKQRPIPRQRLRRRSFRRKIRSSEMPLASHPASAARALSRATLDCARSVQGCPLTLPHKPEHVYDITIPWRGAGSPV